MNLQGSDLHGQHVLQKLGRQQRARAILGNSSTPGKATLSALAGGLVAAAVSFFVERSSIPESLASVVVGVVVAIVLIGFEQWRIERRLEAVIELLKLDDTEAK
jgi:protein-S-isoprenylcysteine O-methyltransferase Ste14